MTSVAHTSYGALRGTRDGAVHVFRGIPFAAPPLGPRRFLPPERAARWSGVRDAARPGPAAPQGLGLLGPVLGLGIGATSEDCLFLNVWTPGVDGARRPVLVFIHGGAFLLGAGSQQIYDGARLARRGDVVVVTINYRLGALGFLDARTLAGGRIPARGNEGLLDQIAALAWVREEIAAFGGDPDNVTIFGESAGAMSCATLLGVPRARGLFHRAILESGALNFVATADAAAEVAGELLLALGLPRADAERLRNLPADRIAEAHTGLLFAERRNAGRLRKLAAAATAIRRAIQRAGSERGRAGRVVSSLRWAAALPLRLVELSAVEPRRWPQGLPFEPVVDGDVLPRHPLESVAAGSAEGIAVLVGTNADEAKLFRLLDRDAARLDEAGLLARCAAVIPGRDESGTPHARRAIDVYRRARLARGASVEPAELWFAIESDRVMRHPATRLADALGRREPRPHAYLFTWPSPVARGALGACHALELPFVFGTLTHPLLRRITGGGPEAIALSLRMQDAWIAFARGGDPSHPGLGAWPRYAPAERATMVLGRQCRVEAAPLETERAFWDTLTPHIGCLFR